MKISTRIISTLLLGAFLTSCSHTFHVVETKDGKGVWMVDTEVIFFFFHSKKFYCDIPGPNQVPSCYEAAVRETPFGSGQSIGDSYRNSLKSQ